MLRFHACARIMQALGAAATVWVLTGGLTYSQTVVEYINQADFPRSPSGQFFYSADPSEQAFVDRGGAGQFKRTGNSFIAGGPQPLCRFYGSVSPGPNSHFYTINPDECAALRRAQITPRPTTVQQWNYEGDGFSATPPVVGADGKNRCAAGTVAVYRAYNNAFTGGVKNPWDSNHRYSTRRADIDYLVLEHGWADEGIAFCVQSEGPAPTYPSAKDLEDKCVAPRSDPKYGDRPGTANDAKEWIRSYIDERYLWYGEVPRLHPSVFSTPEQYFAALRTREKTASGKDKDEFHFTIPTPQWEAFEVGDAGFGFGFEVVPALPGQRPYPVVSLVEPGSPAALAGVTRSMEVRSVNGVSLYNGMNGAVLAGAMRPRASGESARFEFFSPSTGQSLSVALISARITRSPVQSVKVLDTPTGKVGYFLFNDFVAAAEGQLIAAINQLKAANVSDLVLDLRYNQGGYVYIASQLAYMIAGERTAGKIFQYYRFNDKRVAENNDPDYALPFFPVATGREGSGTTAGTPLPTLNLSRLFVLTSNETASASEAVINGLRGIDVPVILVGDTTTGKPFGFVAEENCGTVYLAIEFQGVNAKGFGDFADGFTPTCRVVADDLSRDFGDVNETRLATALAYRATGQCPAGTAAIDHAKTDALMPRIRLTDKLPLMLALPREQHERLMRAARVKVH